MNRRYEFLDGLRGVAALMVVLLHFLTPMEEDGAIVPHAQLAVDFFFCLSGFVLTHAYGDRLGRRMTIGNFYVARWIRLAPMLMLGVVVGTAVTLVNLAVQHRMGEVWRLLGASLTNLLLLPSSLFPPDRPEAWHANPPAWSLYFEFAISMAFPWLLRVRNGWLVAIVCASGTALTVHSMSGYGVHGGENWGTLPVGWARVTYSFVAGMWLHGMASTRAWDAAESAGGCIVTAVLLVAILVVPVPEGFDGLYEALAVLFFLPALMLYASTLAPTRRLKPLVLWLGAVSYPLYSLHYPAVRMFWGPLRRADPLPAWLYALLIAVAMAGCMVVAWLAFRKIDEPVRRRLTRWHAIIGRVPLAKGL